MEIIPERLIERCVGGNPFLSRVVGAENVVRHGLRLMHASELGHRLGPAVGVGEHSQRVVAAGGGSHQVVAGEVGSGVFQQLVRVELAGEIQASQQAGLEVVERAHHDGVVGVEKLGERPRAGGEDRLLHMAASRLHMFIGGAPPLLVAAEQSGPRLAQNGEEERWRLVR